LCQIDAIPTRLGLRYRWVVWLLLPSRAGEGRDGGSLGAEAVVVRFSVALTSSDQVQLQDKMFRADCANEIQHELGKRNSQLAEHRRMQFRTGINLAA
jgi:hypothetical protein